MPSTTIDETDLVHGLNKEIAREQNELMNATDWPDFKERRGRIAGLKKALEFEAKINQFEDDDKD